MKAAKPRRVVVTGMGLVSPLGNTLEALWDALTAGRSGVGPLEMVPAEHLPITAAAEAKAFTGHIDNFGPLEKEQKKSLRKRLSVMCREIQFGIAAAQWAMAHAGLLPNHFDPDRTGVVYGSDYMMTLPEEFTDGVLACMDEQRKFHFSRWAAEGLPRVAPLWLLKYLPNMPAAYIAIYNDLRGPNNSITIREASANLAFGEAMHIISRGDADILVTGSTGTRVHPIRTVHIALQEELAGNGKPPERLSRPFDRDRTGMVLGEGCGALVLEALESAQARGAAILAEVVGCGSSSVMDRNFRAHRDVALANAMRQALREAQIEPRDVGHIHAHGLSTRQCDIDEARALAEVFGPALADVPLVAAKSYFGNLGAGSGAVELIASIVAMHRGRLFPVLNYEQPDPECPVPAVTTHDVAAGDYVLSANVTPQGQASAIVVRRWAE